jgi:hypothetical protein
VDSDFDVGDLGFLFGYRIGYYPDLLHQLHYRSDHFYRTNGLNCLIRGDHRTWACKCQAFLHHGQRTTRPCGGHRDCRFSDSSIPGAVMVQARAFEVVLPVICENKYQ